MAMMALFGPARLTRDVDLDFPELRKRTADSLHDQVMRARVCRELGRLLSGRPRGAHSHGD